MRGAAVAVMLGCAFGGIAFAAGNSHVISDVQLSSAVQPIPQKAAAKDTKPTKSAKTTKTAAQAMKTVTYRGYSIQVPSSWPVYSLDKDPSKCVRYDVNAVYLGTPGPNQDCPPHLIGHADTVSIGGPLTPGEPSVPVKTDLRASVGAKRAGADADMPVAPGTILQNSQLREYAVSMPGSAPAISATYGRRPSLVLHLLASLHLATPQQDQPAAQPDALNAPTVKTSAQPQPTTSPSPPLWIPPSFPVPTPSPTGSSTPKPSPTGSGAPKPSPAGSSAPKPSPTGTAPKPSPSRRRRHRPGAARRRRRRTGTGSAVAVAG